MVSGVSYCILNAESEDHYFVEIQECYIFHFIYRKAKLL